MQQESKQFNRMLALAHRNHLYAEFLLGWISLPLSEERCEQACEMLLATIRLGDKADEDLLRAVRRAWTARADD